MKSKSFTVCAFAGAVLATTIGSGNSTAMAASRNSHHAHGRTAGLSTHPRILHRVALRTRGAHRHYAEASAGRTRPGNETASEHRSVDTALMSGVASVYSGGHTASGEVASAAGLTAAHRSLPFGTMVKVTSQDTGRSVVVRINDRGPFVRGRVIDVTPTVARVLGFSGLAPVKLDLLRG